MSRIDLDEVDVVKFHGITVLIDGPVDLETRLHGIGQVVHIALAHEGLEPVIASTAAHVDGRIGQLGTAEGEHRILDPQWPVGLVVERVAPNVAACAVGIDVVAGPGHILDVVDEGPALMRHFCLALVGLVVGDLKATLAAVIGRALDFIPLVAVTGHAVAVHIDAHHDDARLAATTGHIGHSIALDGITVDLHVIVVLIDHRVVEAEDDVAAIAAQADRGVEPPAQGRFELSVDAVLGVAGFVGRIDVDKLARGRHVVIDTGDVGRVAGNCRQCHHSQGEK